MALTKEQLLQQFAQLQQQQQARKTPPVSKPVVLPVVKPVLKPTLKPVVDSSKAVEDAKKAIAATYLFNKTVPKATTAPVINFKPVQVIEQAKKAIEDSRSYTERREDRKPGAFVSGVNKGADTMFGMNRLDTGSVERNRIEQLKAQNPKTFGAGEATGAVLSSLIPFGGGEALAARILGKAAPKLAGTGLSLAKGALGGAGVQGLSDIAQGKSAEETLKDVAIGTALGAGAELGLTAVGKLLKSMKAGKQVSEVLQDIPTFEAVKQELNLPVTSTVDDVQKAVDKMVVNRSDVKRVQKPQETILTPEQPTTPPINKNASEAVTAPSEVELFAKDEVIEAIGKKYKVIAHDDKNIITIDIETGKQQNLPKAFQSEFKKAAPINKTLDIEERDAINVGSQKVKAYQYENPEYKPFFQEMARNTLYDLDATTKGGTTHFIGEVGQVHDTVKRLKRSTSSTIESILDNAKTAGQSGKNTSSMSYADIRKGLEDIIQDKGSENNAVAKRVEIYLHDALKDGYKTVDGMDVPPNQDYIKASSKEAPVTWSNLDMDAPPPPKEYEVYVPGVTPEGGQKVRKTISNSAMGSEMVPDASKAQFADEIAKGKQTYQATTNIKDYTNAQARVSEDYNTALSDFYKLETLRSADDTALAEALASRAYQNGDNATGHDVLSRLAEMATKAGQSVQAIAILKRMSPEGMLYHAQKQIDNATRAIKEGAGEYTKKAEKAVKEATERIKKAKTPEEKEKILKEITGVKPKSPRKPRVVEGIELPPEKTLQEIVYDMIQQGKYDDKSIRDVVVKKFELPVLTGEQKDYIVRTMQRATALPDGKEKTILMGQINQMIADSIPTDTGSKIAALLRVSMLLNPKTLVTRNPLGNVIFGGLENIKQVPATLADTALSKFTGKRTTTLPSLGAQAKGTVKGIKEATEDIKYNIDTAISRGGVELPNSKKIFDESKPAGKALNTLHNWMGNALKYGDRPFYEAAKDARLAELKKLGPKTGMTPEEMEASAIEEGLARTFQNRGQTVKQIESLKKGLGPLMGQAAMPFVTTPANIIAKGMEYTPLGVVKLFNEAVTKPRQFKGFDQKSFVDTLGRTMTGTAIALTGYNLAKEGHITGGPSKNADVSGLNKVTGEQNYAINFGDGSSTFDWAQPAAIPLAIGVDFYQSGKDKESLVESMAAGLTGAGNTLMNMSVLNGMNQMFRGYSPAEGIATTALGTPLQTLPTLGSQIAAYTDENQRQYESGIVGGLKSKAMSKIPGLRQQMPEKIGIDGKPLKQFQGRKGVGRAIEAFLLPNFYAKKTTDPVLKEIQSVYKSTGVTGIIPSVAPKSFTSDGVKVNLDASKQAEFQRLQGTEAIRRIQEYIASPGWNNMSDEEKAKYMKKAVDKAYDMAKEQTLKK